MHRRSRPGRGQRLHIALWVAQVLLFVAFATAAWMKIAFPIQRLSAIWPWTGTLPVVAVRSLGVIDLLGGLGVVLPMATHFWPRLVVVAATCCAVLQVCAAIFHVSRGEAADTPINTLLLAMAVFIAWGRRQHSPACVV